MSTIRGFVGLGGKGELSNEIGNDTSFEERISMGSLRDLVLGAVINAGTASAVGGALVLSLKSWLARKLDLKFKLMEERAKAYIELNKEVDKTRALKLLDRQNTIYPEVLEVVHRLRNSLRDILAIFASARWKVDRGLNRKDSGQIRKFSSALYLLTENLYKYEAFVEKDVFKDLHRFKRILQDSSVVIDLLTRAENGNDANLLSGPNPVDGLTDIQGSLVAKLHTIYDESDGLYKRITIAIREKLQGGGGERDSTYAL